jgi:FKBP-type peptidyl-prolyl cis-trans isomerase
MKKLSLKEWIGASVAIIFVAYMFFGGAIMSAFRGSALSADTNTGAVNNSIQNNENNNMNDVQVQDVTVGTGAPVGKGMLISVNYVLRLADGSLIQDSKQVNNGQPFQYIAGAGQLITGWERGVEGMKVGGKRVITIPPELGYGANAAGPIPANSTLVFEIEVVDVKPFVQQ